MTSTAQATHSLKGIDVPATGTYKIDPSHSAIAFSVRHLVVAKARGRFTGFGGDVTIADDPLASSVAVTIDAASIDTGDGARDNHLRSGDFLNVEAFPTLTYRSTGVRQVKGSTFVVDGELTIVDQTKPVSLELTYEGAVTDPWGGSRIVFTAKTEVDRDEFGVGWNQVLETGGLLVGKTVTIEIEAEAVLQQ